MIVAKVSVDGTNAKATLLQPITSGMVGAEVEIKYSAAWDGMTKTVVFSGACVRDVITDEHVVRIPPEVLSRSGAPLMVGVYGRLGRDICIPTVWARVCSISRGCDPSGDVSTDPTLPVWAEILETAKTAEQIAQSVREDADAGAFDGAPGKTPEAGVDYGTPEQIADIANQAAGILADNIQKISDGKVDKVEGMGLSSNDYDNAAKAKVDDIPDDPKYTDTIYDDTGVIKVLSQIKGDLINFPLNKTGFFEIGINKFNGKLHEGILNTDGTETYTTSRFTSDDYIMVKPGEVLAINVKEK